MPKPIFTMPDEFTAFDIEVTGLRPEADRIIAVDLAHFTRGEFVWQKTIFIQPPFVLSRALLDFLQMKESDFDKAPTMVEAHDEVAIELNLYPTVGYDVSFDSPYVKAEFEVDLQKQNPPSLDVLPIMRQVFPGMPSYKIGLLSNHFKLTPINQTHGMHARQYGELLLYAKSAQESQLDEPFFTRPP